MTAPTAPDRLVGFLLLLRGSAGLWSVAGGAAASHYLGMPTADPAMLAFAAIVGTLALVGGIGVSRAARWGHMVAVVGMALAVVLGAKELSVSLAVVSAAPGDIRFAFSAILRVVVALALGTYCFWRLASGKA